MPWWASTVRTNAVALARVERACVEPRGVKREDLNSGLPARGAADVGDPSHAARLDLRLWAMSTTSLS